MEYKIGQYIGFADNKYEYLILEVSDGKPYKILCTTLKGNKENVFDRSRGHPWPEAIIIYVPKHKMSNLELALCGVAVCYQLDLALGTKV